MASIDIHGEKISYKIYLLSILHIVPKIFKKVYKSNTDTIINFLLSRGGTGKWGPSVVRVKSQHPHRGDNVSQCTTCTLTRPQRRARRARRRQPTVTGQSTQTECLKQPQISARGLKCWLVCRYMHTYRPAPQPGLAAAAARGSRRPGMESFRNLRANN